MWGVSMPHRLGRYAVRRRIGSGGFATVWLAYDEQLDSPVAIKVLADNWTEDHQIRQRFLEEGRYLRKVESPHVVSVYDAGELDDGRPYLVMSYADQGTLADRLDVEGLTPAQAMEVVRQVGAGLQALHDRDILHRDIKPANVLFRSVDGAEAHGVRAMVGDLGLGKSLDMSSRLTMIAGTPTYVAPEQAVGPGARRARRPVLPRRPGLPAAHRPAAVHPHLAVRRDEPRRRCRRSRRRSGRSRRPSSRCCTAGWRATATTATRPSPSSSTRWPRRSARSPPGRRPSRGSTATPS